MFGAPRLKRETGRQLVTSEHRKNDRWNPVPTARHQRIVGVVAADGTRGSPNEKGRRKAGPFV